MRANYFCLAMMVFLNSLVQTFSVPSSLKEGILCNLCRDAQQKLFSLADENLDGFVKLAMKICKLGVSPNKCNYFVKNKGLNLIPAKMEFLRKSDYFCSQQLMFCESKLSKFSIDKFTKDLYNKYPPVESPKTKNGKAFNALTLNDIHVQPNYAPKSSIVCPDNVGCCSAEYGFPMNEKLQAGYWGSPNAPCDIPTHLFEKTLEEIRDRAKAGEFDMIFVLGDIPGHNYFTQPDDYVANVTSYVFRRLKEVVGIPVVPVVGNHEGHPVDFFDFDDPNSYGRKHIYGAFKDLITEQEYDQLNDSGFFERELPENNIKLIAFNTQLMDYYNDFLTRNGTNPLGSLDKLAKTFSESERKGQKVVFLTHIPPHDSKGSITFPRCLHVIFDRFKSTLTAVLSGHTHKDQLKFFTSDELTFGINFISPSLTTEGSHRPSFRIYEFREGEVYDYRQFNANIDEFNKRARNDDFDLNFELAYEFRNEYALKGSKPSEYLDLKDALQDLDGEALKKYAAHQYTQPRPYSMEELRIIVCNFEGEKQRLDRCLEPFLPPPSLSDRFEQLYRILFENEWFVSKDSREREPDMSLAKS